MSLISVVIMAFLAPLAAFGAFRAFKLTPTTRNRSVAVLLLFVAYAFGLSVSLLLPGAYMRDAQDLAERDQVRLDARLNEVREMSQALGGPQAYIEYLKATKAD